MRTIQFYVLTCLLLGTAEISLLANPTGGNVTAGAASITGQGTSTVTINQTTNTAVINWQSFSIGSGELTSFLQPSANSAVLNRVLGGQTSIINGTLSANGQVFLINGNGILVGAGGVVNTNAFTASTRDIADSDFLSGNLHFTGSNSSGVQNLGTITAAGGDVYLIGKTVDNTGTITASSGTVGLASGDDVLLNLGGQEHVFVSPSPTAIAAPGQTAVHNGGTIAATSAELKAANGNLFALAINNEGAVRATTVTQSGGRIFLTADSGAIQNTGTLAAKSGANGGQIAITTGGSVWNTSTISASGANGGSVTVNTKNFQNDGTITAQGTTGTGGSVAVNFSGNALGSTSGDVDARGATLGGSILFDGTGADSEAYLSLRIDDAGSQSTGGSGGEITIDAPTVYLTGATLIASGATQGGSIFIGESDPSATVQLPLAQTVYVSTGTSLEATSKKAGQGGQILVDASGTTEFLGSADVSSAGTGGTGGLIEVSGQGATYFGGTANASASGGTSGTFVLDPQYITVANIGSSAALFEFVDPDPGPDNDFGNSAEGGLAILNGTGTTLITSPGDSFSADGAGAVYLFSDSDGALLSTLRGSHAGDAVGSELFPFADGNFAVISPSWNGDRGAITYGNGTTGFYGVSSGGIGVVSASNSLVGSTSGDEIGSGGSAYLIGNNGLVFSPDWGSTKGAVTFIAEDGTGYTPGAISASNSLVGAASGDRIGEYGSSELNNLSTGNTVLQSVYWGDGAGAVTLISATSPTTGVVGPANSLVGSSSGDSIGSGGIDDLGNGYYLVFSPSWNSQTGAVTLCNSSTATSETVSSANSLVGATSDDLVGNSGYMTLLDGDSNVEGYLIQSPDFNGSAGALTWFNGTSLPTGPITASNSLIGGTSGDNIGSGGIEQLSGTGNYLVFSPDWSVPGDEPIGNAGAVTFFNGSATITGTVNSSNSLVGANSGDKVGIEGIISLSGPASGNFLILSPDFNGGAGAVTWFNGSSGPATGTVSGSNSLVGSNSGDGIAGDVSDLGNGYYVLDSSGWNNNTGAVTVGNGTTGTSGVVSSSNSLTGGNTGDQVGSGGIVTLTNGNFVVLSPDWANPDVEPSITHGAITPDTAAPTLPPVADAGAATFVNASAGVNTTGTVTTSNSIVGTNSGDMVSSGGVSSLSNGNYVVNSPQWNDGTGAVTFGNGTSGTSLAVDFSNSLTGGSTGDQVGSGGIITLSDGNYLVNSPSYSSGTGAITWVNGSSGEAFGEESAGAEVSSSNSLVGSTTGDFQVGDDGVQTPNNAGYYLVLSSYDGTGAVTWGADGTGVAGVVSSSNSLVGSSTDDNVGSGGITVLGDGNYLVSSPDWQNDNGAVTWVNGSTGVPFGGETPGAVVSSTNSLVGSGTDDHVGGGGIDILNDGNYLVVSPNSSGGTDFSGAGAVTWGAEGVGVAGAVSSSNSLVGADVDDHVGSGMLIQLSDGDNYLIQSPQFNSGAGAVTWLNDSTGVTGVVSSTTSLVGENSGDGVGTGCNDVFTLSNNNYLLLTPTWGEGEGAVTFLSGPSSAIGTVNSDSSLVGSTSDDSVGSSNSIHQLSDGNYLVVTPNWNDDTGAVTWGSGTTGISGVISSSNSLVGSNNGDEIGSGGVTDLPNGDYVVQSPYFNQSAGAVTWGDESVGVDGVITGTNSIIGGVSNAGETLYGYYDTTNPDLSIYYVSFTNDTSAGGDGRVYAGWFNGPPAAGGLLYNDEPNQSVTINPSVITAITDNGTNVVLQGNTDVTVDADIITVPTSSEGCDSIDDATLTDAITTDCEGSTGGNITIDAGRSIIINANITTANGDLTLLANDPNAISTYRVTGAASITQESGTTLDVGDGTFIAEVVEGGAKAPTVITTDEVPQRGTNGLAGNIVLGSVDADTVIISAIDPVSNITLNGPISANQTTIGAGNAFINNAGASAISGDWSIYSETPSNDAFGGLASGNFATFGACPPEPPLTSSETPAAESEGDHYLFGIAPVLTVVALDRTKASGDTIDYTSPVVGVDYAVSGFFDAASFGNVFTQDTVANTFCGSPDLSSAGAPASAAPGTYAIDITQGNLSYMRRSSGYVFNPCNPGSFVNGTMTVGNFFADSSSDPDDSMVTTFEVTGFNHQIIFPQFTIVVPNTIDFSPIGVNSETLGAINDGDGAYILLGSSTQGDSGPDRLVLPGNIWDIFSGSVHEEPPPGSVLNQFQLNLNAQVYSQLHQFLFGTP